MRVSVTGATGRLGRALLAAVQRTPGDVAAPGGGWTRADLDLDTVTSEGAARLLRRDRPDVVIHAAAWTDVDGCARDPDLAYQRNAVAPGRLATACAERGVDLVLVSTNEVFDGHRTDGVGYGPDDPVGPINPYGASKLEGEGLAAEAFERADKARLAIVRTAWLFGPPGSDFPAKILAAAARAQSAHEPLRAVSDEIGSPTYTGDLAVAILALLRSIDLEGVHHVVNGDGGISRAVWARAVLDLAAVDVAIDEVSASTWQRASTPPRWGVLAPTALPGGPLRSWRAALAEHVPTLVEAAPVG